MRCVICGADETRVVDSRPAEGGLSIRRRRECLGCAHRYTTYERPAVTLVVRKRDGTLQPYDPRKIRQGVENAVADRPVPAGTIETILGRIEATGHSDGPELNADQIGREVLIGLREVDEVAYLRFASVYKDFKGASDFEREMAALEES